MEHYLWHIWHIIILWDTSQCYWQRIQLSIFISSSWYYYKSYHKYKGNSCSSYNEWDQYSNSNTNNKTSGGVRWGVHWTIGVSVDVVTELTKVRVMMDVTKEETALDVTPPVTVDATTLLVELVALVAEIKRIN